MEENKIIEIKTNVELIKPYLESIGYDFTIRDTYDKFAFHLASRDDLRYLSFGIMRYKMNEYSDLEKYENKFGQIIYDKNGNVLSECLKEKSPYCFFYGGETITYGTIPESSIFMDDFALFTFEDNIRMLKYKIYRKEEDKYQKIGEYNEPCVKMEKTSGGEIFIKDGGRLISIRDLNYVGDLKFKDIIGLNCSPGDFRYDIAGLTHSLTNSNMKTTILDILHNNDVLFAYDYISALYQGTKKNATIFAFIDTKGNIVSKLYVKSYDEFYSVDVTNETYEDVKQSCILKLENDIKRTLANERRRETRERNICNNALNQMLDTVSSINFDDYNQEGFSKVLLPNNKK